LYDGPHATPKPADEGPVFLGIGNITEDGRLDLTQIRHIAEEDFPNWTKRVNPCQGDIVFTYEATLNRYALIPEGFRGCLGRRLALIRPNPEKVDRRFLFYYFFSEDWRATIARNTLSGATVDRIPITKFPEFEICLPSLPTQRKIAAILSAYDDLIENNTRRIKILEEMAQALYREWFVHFRFPGHEKVKMVPSPMGPIPSGWRADKLKEHVELAYGKALKAEDRHAGPFPVYGSSGVVGNHSEMLINGPGVIVGRKGNVGSVHWSDESFYPIDTVYYVQTDLPLFYVFFNLQTQNFINNDAAVPGLNRNQAYSLSFLLPPTTVLTAFNAFCKPLFGRLRSLRAANSILRRTRDLLLPKLVSGAIDVANLDIRT
jgi:type I restriction enzyme S subunit